MRAVNLIPEERRGDAALGSGRSGGGAYAVLGLLAGLTILALVYGIARHDVSNRKAELATINAREQHANESTGHLQAYTSFLTAREERTKMVTELADSRFAWAHSLYELGRVLPAGVSISSLTGSVGTAATSAGGGSAASKSSSSEKEKSQSGGSTTPPGSVPIFMLTGCATSQSMVGRMLNRLSLIHGVTEATLQASSSGGASAGSSPGGGSSGSCPNGAPSFTVQVSYAPLPASAGGSSTSAGTSDASNSTLSKAESTGGGG